MTAPAFRTASAEYIAESLGVRYCGMQFGYYLYNDDHVTGGSFTVAPSDNCLDGVASALGTLRKNFNKAV